MQLHSLIAHEMGQMCMSNLSTGSPAFAPRSECLLSTRLRSHGCTQIAGVTVEAVSRGKRGSYFSLGLRSWPAVWQAVWLVSLCRCPRNELVMREIDTPSVVKVQDN